MANLKHPSSSYARIIFRHLRLSKASSQAYFDGTNVSYEELMTLDGLIPRKDLARMYRNAIAISGLEDLGLSVGTQLHLSAHGPLGVAALSAPDLRSALLLFGKYSRTRADFFDISVSENSEGLTVTVLETFDLDDLREFITETTLKGLFLSIGFFVGAEQFKGSVRFSYPKPSYWQKYRAHFGSDITFGGASTEVFISRSILSAPSPVADPVMYEEAVAICAQQLKTITGGANASPLQSIEAVVSNLILENPGRIWTLNDVAARLSMSPRTLIRKLKAEGTKFQVLRDQQSKRQVANYLADGSLSVESVAHLMGYSDVSSFRRSFKRWFGETPSQYMAKLKGD